MTSKTKTCTECDQVLSYDSFPLNGSRSSAKCLPCKQSYDREYYHKNKAKLLPTKIKSEQRRRNRNR